MARVEKNAGVEDRLEDVKGEMVREVRRRTRASRPWLTCSVLVLGVLVAFCVWGVWMVAGTGLVQVPLFTSLAFEEPTPQRVVTPGVPVQTVLDELFTSTLTRRLYEGGGTLQDRSIEARLSESSLTASLRTLLESSGIDWIDGAQGQVVVEPEVGIELFVPLVPDEQGKQTAVTATFDLTAGEEGHLVVVPLSVRVGSTQVPKILIGIFLKPFLEAELAKLNTVLVGYAQISKIEEFSRELVVTGELAVEIQESL